MKNKKLIIYSLITTQIITIKINIIQVEVGFNWLRKNFKTKYSSEND